MDDFHRFAGKPRRHFEHSELFARIRREAGCVKGSIMRIAVERKFGRRRPPEAGLPVPAVPPRGPLPLAGGAEAPLEFRED